MNWQKFSLHVSLVCSLLVAMFLSPWAKAATAYWEDVRTENYLTEQNGIVFYAGCVDRDGFVSLLIFPSSMTQGWYVMNEGGAGKFRGASQYGAVFIENGKWRADGFSNLPYESQKIRGRPVERMMTLPFTALQKKDFHQIFDVKPKAKCP